MVKFGSFWGPKWRHMSKFCGGTKIFFLKTVSKVILVRFINITVVKNVINGFNLVKIGHFCWKWPKNSEKSAPRAYKLRHMWKNLWGTKNFFWKCSVLHREQKTSMVLGLKMKLKWSKGRKTSKIRFLVKF